MQTQRSKSPVKFIVAGLIIVATVSWLAYSGAQDTKQYYVTIAELQAMGPVAYTRNLRVAGNVLPGSIVRNGPNAVFTLTEQGKNVKVDYEGAEPPPDTFKDDSQALADGSFEGANIIERWVRTGEDHLSPLLGPAACADLIRAAIQALS